MPVSASNLPRCLLTAALFAAPAAFAFDLRPERESCPPPPQEFLAAPRIKALLVGGQGLNAYVCTEHVANTRFQLVHLAVEKAEPSAGGGTYVFDLHTRAIDWRLTEKVERGKRAAETACRSGKSAKETSKEALPQSCSFEVVGRGADDLEVRVTRSCSPQVPVFVVAERIRSRNEAGLAAWRSGKKEEATRLWMRAIEEVRGCVLSDPYGELCNNGGYGLFQTGHVQDALEVLRACARDSVPRATLQLNLGEALEMLGHKEEALTHYLNVFTAPDRSASTGQSAREAVARLKRTPAEAWQKTR